MNASVRLLEAVIPSSVTVRAEIPAAHASAQILGTERTGSGTLVDASGVVLTVNYIVMGAENVEVTLIDDTTTNAEIVAQDFHTGLAVLRIPGGSHPFLRGQVGVSPQSGEEVFILASGGGGSRRLNTGAIFSIAPFEAYWEYHLDRGILTTVMNPGFGGGALLNKAGQLIGIVSLDLNEVGRFTLAIPVEHFFDHREELLRYGRRTTRPSRAWVGIFSYEMHGHVVVAGLLPGAPGERAGLRAGDIILGVNGKKVKERRGFYHSLWAHKPGDTIHFDVFRQNAVREFQIQAGDAERFFA
jgi:S1-C subfamily serine protease